MKPSPLEISGGRPIIFFDGVCALCNRTVNGILARDHDAQFRFAPIQGETAERFLPPLDDDPGTWSIVYVDETGVHRESDAAIRIARRLGGGLAGLLGLARIVPRALRDPVYRLIARNRYRWFGRRENCRVPTPTERERFLP
jgi:predicted DCC family thiol-disulfide oxidoreductase YuxK